VTAAATIVVITRNRRDECLLTLQRLTALPGGPSVTVVDNASTDGTARAVRDANPAVHVVASDDNLGAAGRNIGVELACTPYVAFADDDSWWAPDALSRATAILDADPGIAAVAARVVVHPGERDDPVCALMAHSPLVRAGTPYRRVLGFLACACVVRRDGFLAAGGFDARFLVGGEEQRVAYDLRMLGGDIVYAPEVVAHHAPSPVRDAAGRARREIRNDLWTAWLRRRPLSVARITGAYARRAIGDPVVRGAMADAARGLGWVRRERRPHPPAFDR
jgi:GT2 family glycosyltransferase